MAERTESEECWCEEGIVLEVLGGSAPAPCAPCHRLPLASLQRLADCLEYDEQLVAPAPPAAPPAPPSAPPAPPSAPPAPVPPAATPSLYTGMMSGGRRIDLVLVMLELDAPAVQQVKAHYLMSLAALGLQLELERPVLPALARRGLVFVKVHAPDEVLLQYIQVFDVKKLFSDTILKFLDANTLLQKLFQYEHEPDLVRLVRSSYLLPLRLSTHDRSYVVLMLLRYTAFGRHPAHVGLERLMDARIVLDAYALHDGPYFFTKEQDFSRVTARQLLFYNWLGVNNLLKLQPLHLVQEYFGPQVAFYFAFYEFYNMALLPLAVAGIFKMIPQVEEDVEYCTTNFSCDLVRRPEFGRAESRNCNRCLDLFACPMLWEGDECPRRWLATSWDNRYLLYLAVATCVWAAAVPALWGRRQANLAWAWELRPPDKPPHRITRPQRAHASRLLRFPRTDVVMRARALAPRLLTALLTGLVLTACALSVFAVVGGMVYGQYVSVRDDKVAIVPMSDKLPSRYILPDYYVRWYRSVTLFAVAALVVLMCLERVFRAVSVWAVRLEDWPTAAGRRRSLLAKLVVFKVLCACTPVMFFAWLKGTFFRFPSLDWFPELTISLLNTETKIKLHFLKHYIHATCSVGTCFDETILVYGVTVVLHLVLARGWRLVWPTRTDYWYSARRLSSVPEWEREYRLAALGEDVLTGRLAALAAQFVLVTYWVPALPLAPALALTFNVWQLRSQARRLLLGTRRPLLVRTGGVPHAAALLAVLGCAAALALTLFLALQTNIIYKYATKNDYYYKPCPQVGSSCELANIDFQFIEYHLDPYILEEIKRLGHDKYMQNSVGSYCHIHGQRSWYKRNVFYNHWRKLEFPDTRNEMCAEQPHRPALENQVCKPARAERTTVYSLLVLVALEVLAAVVVTLVRYYVPPQSARVRRLTAIQCQLARAYRLAGLARPPAHPTIL